MSLKVEQLVTFCVLMENNTGIVGKAPDYLIEKYEAVQKRKTRAELLGLLDLENQSKFKRYVQTWRLEEK